MIVGALVFSGHNSGYDYVDRIVRAVVSGSLSFQPVDCRHFKGGFFLHDNIPCKAEDFYFRNETNDLLVLLSGYIYNREELCRKFRIHSGLSDPQLIAALYLQAGPGFVNALNGDYAIFILEQKKKLAFLFRDHVGIRPVAFINEGGVLCFSSDINGICRAFSDGKLINREYLMGYFKYVDYRITPNTGVERLLPGHYLRISGSGLEIIKYWNPGKIKADRKLRYDVMISDLEGLVRDAVKIRCDSRFAAGAHVSSGLDSGLVAALARDNYRQQKVFHGFSWSPADYTTEGFKYDERDLAVKAAEKANIRLWFSDMALPGFTGIVSEFYYNHGHFSEDNTIRQAVKTGTNLLFSGWGGDEFVSTGERGVSLDLLRGLHFRIFFRRNPIKNFRNFVKNQLFYVVYPAFNILDRNIKKSFSDDARYIRKAFKKSDRKAIRNFYFHESRHQLHLRMLRFYHLQDRCESWMLNGYRNGIEYRYPLLDRRIIEYMLKVPTLLLCKNNNFRPLLRELGRDLLPEEVRWNWSKNDPVWWSHMKSLYKESSALFMEEADRWKDNTELDFIDFDLLFSDIGKYKHDPGSIDGLVLFRALVYIKAIHEFTSVYHGRR